MQRGRRAAVTRLVLATIAASRERKLRFARVFAVAVALRCGHAVASLQLRLLQVSDIGKASLGTSARQFPICNGELARFETG